MIGLLRSTAVYSVTLTCTSRSTRTARDLDRIALQGVLANLIHPLTRTHFRRCELLVYVRDGDKKRGQGSSFHLAQQKYRHHQSIHGAGGPDRFTGEQSELVLTDSSTAKCPNSANADQVVAPAPSTPNNQVLLGTLYHLRFSINTVARIRENFMSETRTPTRCWGYFEASSL